MTDNQTPNTSPSPAEKAVPAPQLEWSAQDGFDSQILDPKLRKAIKAMGWEKPTEVQELCLPHTLAGKDVAGFAQTGTGKTAVFLVTVANRILAMKAKSSEIKTPICVILTPTRELAIQIESDAETLFSELGISSLPVYGGVDYEKQANTITSGVDVIVATPGRSRDYAKKNILKRANIEIFVCDEADRMFDMGFIDDVEFFLDKIPDHAQKLLFSATTNDSVKELAFEYLNNPEYISAQPDSITPELIDQKAYIVDAQNKLKVMLGLMKEQKPACSIIFTNTKLTGEWLQFKLNNNGLETDLITGDIPQRKRISLIKRIKAGEVKALIATDVVSRGLHIAGVTHVYNFDLPDDASNYIHRIGRTARAGASGCAVSLVCEDYGDNLYKINELLGDSPLSATWYDPAYDKIEDKAGNPYEQKKAPAVARPRGNTQNRDRKTPSKIRNQKSQQDRFTKQVAKPNQTKQEQKNVQSLSLGQLCKKFVSAIFGKGKSS